MSKRPLPSEVRSEIIDFLDDPTQSHSTISSAALGYAISMTKIGDDQIRLSCPDRWLQDFLQHFDGDADFVRADSAGVTAHEQIVRHALKTDVGGVLSDRGKAALLDKEDRLILCSDDQHLRVLLLAIATARAEKGQNVVLYSTKSGSLICMDLLEAAEGLGVRFDDITHSPLEATTGKGRIRVVKVLDTTSQQAPVKGRGVEGDVFVYVDAGKQSFKQVKETTLPARLVGEVEVVAGTSQPLVHNRPPTGAQATLTIADEPRLYWV